MDDYDISTHVTKKGNKLVKIFHSGSVFSLRVVEKHDILTDINIVRSNKYVIATIEFAGTFSDAFESSLTIASEWIVI